MCACVRTRKIPIKYDKRPENSGNGIFKFWTDRMYEEMRHTRETHCLNEVADRDRKPVKKDRKLRLERRVRIYLQIPHHTHPRASHQKALCKLQTHMYTYIYTLQHIYKFTHPTHAHGYVLTANRASPLKALAGYEYAHTHTS